MSEKVCACIENESQRLSFRFDETDERCARLKALLQKNIEDLILNKGVTRFISGMGLGAETCFAEIVLELRDEKYPEITLEAAIPYETQAEHRTETQRDRYYSVLSCCDKETMLQTHYTDDCMQRRNIYMTDKCDYLIAVCGSSGAIGSAAAYAAEKGKKVIQIDPQALENSEAEKSMYA